MPVLMATTKSIGEARVRKQRPNIDDVLVIICLFGFFGGGIKSSSSTNCTVRGGWLL